MIKLRDPQVDFINAIRNELKTHKEVLGRAPTGFGKTIIASYMLKSASDKNFRSWFIVHKRELVKQSVKAFEKIGARVGVINPDYPEDLRANIQVCSIDTLINRIDRLPSPHLVIWDECHHMGAKTWNTVFEALKPAYQIGLTATPWRLDKKGLGRWFKTMVAGPEVEWLIQNKYLCDYKVYGRPFVHMDDVKTKLGDVDLKDFEEKAGNEFFGSVVDEYMEKAAGKRAVLFASSIEASFNFCEEFAKRGIVAVHIDGKISALDRDIALKKFESGEAQVLSNYGIVSEGFDIPAIEVVILARPTMSLSLYLQMVGRALRMLEGKDFALILDHVGNVELHGFPDDIREWSLEDRPKRESTVINAPKVCPKCYYHNDRFARYCEGCAEPLTQAKAERGDNIDYVDGKLVEIDKLALKKNKKKEEKECRDIPSLESLGRRRGYKEPEKWAERVFELRKIYKDKAIAQRKGS